MIPQSTFMISAQVPVEKLQSLRALLISMNQNQAPGHAEPYNKLLPFGRFERLHFARFIVMEANTAHEISAFGVKPRPWHPTLVFLGDIDGDRDAFLAELTAQASSGLKEIFSYCEGFCKESTDLLDWMKANNLKPGANYVNWLGRTVRQIHEEAALHDSLSLYLQDITDDISREDTRPLQQKLLSHVAKEVAAGSLTLSAPEPTPGAWKVKNILHKIGVPLLLLILLPLVLIMAPFYLLRLRMLERSEPELFIRPSREHLKALTVLEDWDASNQYSVFGDVKPGLFRLMTFKTIVFLTDYFARHVYNKGFLARIKTIHFARWVFMDNNHRVFFASSYDGSHESYMDDFINKVGWGLNIIFSSGVGYPNTRWLIKDGARREHPFKYTQRRHQIPTEVWYKAYPDLTATDLARNSRIRQGAETELSTDTEVREWLSLI